MIKEQSFSVRLQKLPVVAHQEMEEDTAALLWTEKESILLMYLFIFFYKVDDHDTEIWSGYSKLWVKVHNNNKKKNNGEPIPLSRL